MACSLLLSLALLASAASAYSSPLRNRARATVTSSSALFAQNDDECASQLQLQNASSDRRAALARIAAMGTTLTISSRPAYSADTAEAQSSLEARSAENSLSVPPYGMEATDIFYPSSFQGTWKALSKTVDIQTPCGYELFTGGQKGYDNAVKNEITDGNDLVYKARFIEGTRPEDGSTYIAADREYNAREIAKAAMGTYSVVDTSSATPNRYSCLLAPPGGSDNLISVDILAIARRSDPVVSSDKFACAEFVRQIVSPARKNNPNAAPVPPLSVKEIETISVYTVVGKDRIECRQRTATFLVPSQTDPMAFQKWQMSRGRPVDVRYYDVAYTRA